jgi:hypothetical protein
MTVQEIIIAAAEELGVQDKVNDYLLNGSTIGKKETETLLMCFNLVENEVALDYLPLKCEDVIEGNTGVIEYQDLSRKAVRVIGVTDEYGNAAPFRLFPKYLKTQPGKVKILYTYTPTEKGITDDCDYDIRASLRLFTYGTLAEYYLAAGFFEESEAWDKKYKDALTAAYRQGKTKVIKSRRWA